MALSKIITFSTTTIKAGWEAFDKLIDDLASATKALGASTIGVEDSAGNMSATDVEAALAEIYIDHSSTRTLAEIFDENSATTTGLTWGYKAGAIRIANTITSVAASTISLTDDATNYIEVNKSGTVIRNTTGFTVGRIPIRQITAASGVQTVSTDKRAWFSEISDDLIIGTTITIPNSGLHILDTNASHDLIIKPGSDLDADRILTLTTGNAARTFSLLANLSIGSGSAVTITAEDAAATITLDNCGLEVEDTANAGNIIKLINANDDTNKSITLHENLTLGAGNDGTLTFTGASKTLSVEDTAIVDQDLTKDAYPQHLGLSDGTYNIALPTNNPGAAKFMLGNSNTIAWFYLNTAPPGWKALSTGADTVLGVSGGSDAFNVNGGNVGGTWTQPNHIHADTLAAPAHTHPAGTYIGPNHTHPMPSGSFIQRTGTDASQTIEAVPNTTSHVYNWSTNAGGNSAITGSSGAASATALTGSVGNGATAATYRPSASVGKLFQLDTA